MRTFGSGFSSRVAVRLTGPLPEQARALLPYAGPLFSAIVVQRGGDSWLLAGPVPAVTLERDGDRLLPPSPFRDAGARRARADQALRRAGRGRRPRPDGRARRALRVPRAERCREDHDDPDGPRARLSDRRRGRASGGAGRRAIVRRSRASAPSWRSRPSGSTCPAGGTSSTSRAPGATVSEIAAAARPDRRRRWRSSAWRPPPTSA